MRMDIDNSDRIGKIYYIDRNGQITLKEPE